MKGQRQTVAEHQIQQLVLHCSGYAARDRGKQLGTGYVNTIRDSTNSVEDPGCFIPDPDPTIFSSRIRIQKFFQPGSRILHEKWNAKLLFFLASYAFRSKVLVIVKKIRDPGSGKKSSRIRI
jgi:hypothetical protein